MMKSMFRIHGWLLMSAALALLITASGCATTTSRQEIDQDANTALARLYQRTPVARKLGREAAGILVFPSVIKGGLMFGGQYGKGVLFKHGRSSGQYSLAAVSWGLQIGAQSLGYVMFLMTPEALDYLEKSEGWEVGVGPTVVLVDEGVEKSLTTSTAKEDIYAFVFDQKGLMAGVNIQGSKISKLTP